LLNIGEPRREEHADAFVLWCAATHGTHRWEKAPRLHVWSPVKQCGKTRTFEIAMMLSHEPVSTVNISSAALVYEVANGKTLFIRHE